MEFYITIDIDLLLKFYVDWYQSLPRALKYTSLTSVTFAKALRLPS